MGALSDVGALLLSLSMMYVKNDSNTQTGTGHEPEVIDISNDHEEEICTGVRASGTLVPRISNLHKFLSFCKYRTQRLHLPTESDVALPVQTISASPSGVLE